MSSQHSTRPSLGGFSRLPALSSPTREVASAPADALDQAATKTSPTVKRTTLALDTSRVPSPVQTTTTTPLVRVDPEEFSHHVLEKYEKLLQRGSSITATPRNASPHTPRRLSNPQTAVVTGNNKGLIPENELQAYDNDEDSNEEDDEIDGDFGDLGGSLYSDDDTAYEELQDTESQARSDKDQQKTQDPSTSAAVLHGGLPYLVTKLGLYRRALLLERTARGRSESALAALTHQLHATSAALSRRDRVISDLLVDLVALEQALHLQRSLVGGTGSAVPPSVLDVIRGNVTGDENTVSASGSASERSEIAIDDRLATIFGSLAVSSDGSSSGGGNQLASWLPSAKEKVREILAELEALKTSFRVLHKDAAEERANLRQKLLLAGRDAAAIAEERRAERTRFQGKLGEAKQAVSLLRNEVIELKEQATQKEKDNTQLRKLLGEARRALLNLGSGSHRDYDSGHSLLKRKPALSQSKLDLTAEIKRILGDQIDDLPPSKSPTKPESVTSIDENLALERSPSRGSSSASISAGPSHLAGSSSASSSAFADPGATTLTVHDSRQLDAKLPRSVSSIEPSKSTVPAVALSDLAALAPSKSELTSLLREQRVATELQSSGLLSPRISPSAVTGAAPGALSVAAVASGQASMIGTAGGAQISEAELLSLREELAEAQKVNITLARRAFEYKTRLDALELRLRRFTVTRVLHFRPSEPCELTIKKITSTGEIFISVTRLVGSSGNQATHDASSVGGGTSNEVSALAQSITDDDDRSEYIQPLGTVTIRPLPNVLRFLLVFSADGNRQMTFDCETSQLRETIVQTIQDMKEVL